MDKAAGGSILWNLDVDSSRFKKGMASAQHAAKDTAKNVDRSSGAFNRFGHAAATAVKQAAVGLATAAIAATGFAIKSAASFEQTRIGLENMLGSADAARAMLQKVSKFAAETPFEFPELAQATRQLVAFGFTGEQAFKTMTQLGDVSAAIGAPIGDLAYLMGTLRAQGRAFTIDIRQFAMRGIPIYEYLAKVFKTNTKEVAKLIEAGKVGFPEVQKAFQLMTAEGGKFHGTMAKQSKSLSGLWSTLKDVIGQTARELVGINAQGDIKKGSLFDRLRIGTAGLIKELPNLVDRMLAVATMVANYLTPKLKALWATFSVELLPTLKRLVPIIGTALVVGIGLAIDAINAIMTVLGPLVRWIARNEDAVKALVIVIGTLWATMKAKAAINAFIGGLNKIGLTSIPGVIRSLGTLKAALVGFTGFGIFAGVALAAFFKVRKEINALHHALDGVDESFVAMEKSHRDFRASLDRAVKEGRYTQAQAKERLRKYYSSVREEDGRASGGPVSGGHTYMVGEEGPELFTPSSAGHITPNDKLGSSMAGGKVNITLNMGGIMARSRSDLRDIARDMVESLNEELRSKNLAVIGGGNL